MPKPKSDESESEYISRFMESEEARKDFPDQKQRAAVAYSMWRRRKGEHENASTSYPKLFKCRHIEPGLVHYNEYGTVLVRKETLDKMSKSFVGKPVVNVVHKNIKPQNFREEADGVVTRHWYNEADGWYWAEFLVWDDSTIRNCQSTAYSVSCAYNVSQTRKSQGEYHNIPYEQEVVDGEYTHLAVVANPRYEGARIILNSKGGNKMKLKFWEKKEEVTNASESDLENTVVEIEGKEVAMKDLIENFQAVNAKPIKLGLEKFVTVGDKEVAVKELVEAYNAKKMKNKDEDKEGLSKELKEEEEEEDERKEDKQAKNSMKEDHEGGKHKKEPMDNCSMCNDLENAGDEHFDKLKAAANRRGEPQMPHLVTIQDQIAEGKKRYGKIAVAE